MYGVWDRWVRGELWGRGGAMFVCASMDKVFLSFKGDSSSQSLPPGMHQVRPWAIFLLWISQNVALPKKLKSFVKTLLSQNIYETCRSIFEKCFLGKAHDLWLTIWEPLQYTLLVHNYKMTWGHVYSNKTNTFFFLYIYT